MGWIAVFLFFFHEARGEGHHEADDRERMETSTPWCSYSSLISHSSASWEQLQASWCGRGRLLSSSATPPQLSWLPRLCAGQCVRQATSHIAFIFPSCLSAAIHITSALCSLIPLLKPFKPFLGFFHKPYSSHFGHSETCVIHGKPKDCLMKRLSRGTEQDLGNYTKAITERMSPASSLDKEAITRT